MTTQLHELPIVDSGSRPCCIDLRTLCVSHTIRRACCHSLSAVVSFLVTLFSESAVHMQHCMVGGLSISHPRASQVPPRPNVLSTSGVCSAMLLRTVILKLASHPPTPYDDLSPTITRVFYTLRCDLTTYGCCSVRSGACIAPLAGTPPPTHHHHHGAIYCVHHRCHTTHVVTLSSLC